ncbi:MAG: 50S ribosomal protein L11 methyltransferase, partial [Acidimicrobiia bacterium]
MSGGARTVHLEVDEGEVELASDALWAAGASAIQEVDLGGGRVRLEADPRDLSGLAGWAFDVVVLDGDGYLDAWQRFARPVRVGRVVLQPDWVAPVATSADDVVVELAPVRAFGTGSHPSTRTALEALVARVGPATTVLDVGSGTGVLAVAAVLAGAARAVAVDVDPVAVRATAALARRHGVADRLVASGTPVAEVEGTFDLVVANIGAGVLRAMAGVLRARLAPGGHLVLAGVLAGQA